MWTFQRHKSLHIVEDRKERKNFMSEKLSVKSWRLAREISQEQMAKKLEVHPNTYILWEKEPSKISVAMSFKIASILNVSFDDIDFFA